MNPQTENNRSIYAFELYNTGIGIGIGIGGQRLSA